MGPEDQYDPENYPCECGGSITFAGAHPNMNRTSSKDESCCGVWECDKCGAVKYEHDKECI